MLQLHGSITRTVRLIFLRNLLNIWITLFYSPFGFCLFVFRIPLDHKREIEWQHGKIKRLVSSYSILTGLNTNQRLNYNKVSQTSQNYVPLLLEDQSLDAMTSVGFLIKRQNCPKWPSYTLLVFSNSRNLTKPRFKPCHIY